jgi:hypothetical protein
MKKIIIIFLFLCLSFSNVNALYNANFTPVADAMVVWDDPSNYGNDTIKISVAYDGRWSNKESFFKFNMSLPDGAMVTNANFTDCFDFITVSPNHGGEWIVSYEIEQDWDENTINYYNKPNYGYRVGWNDFPYGNGQVINRTWDLTSLAQKHQEDGYINFVVTPYPYLDNVFLGYSTGNSKEKPAGNVFWNGNNWQCYYNPYQYCQCIVSGYFPPIMSVDYSICDDSICEGVENQTNCCNDCGCQQPFLCENNRCIRPLEYTLRDIGQGTGNLLLNMSPPLTIFIILLAIVSMIGFIFVSFGKKTGGNI